MYPQLVSPSAPLPPMYPSPTNFNANQSNSYRADSDERLRKFEYIVNRYEINREFAIRLRTLEGCEIVFIIDDSGSMNTQLGNINSPFDKSPTRWDELRQTVSIVVDVASVFDPDGVDLFFLNREPMRHVKDSSELIPIFAVPPSGATPILRTFRQVLSEKQMQAKERKLLILIATDGVPTDEQGTPDMKSLKKALLRERIPMNNMPVTIIACTDDDDCIGYLNNWDKNIPNLDVVDDYKSEKEEILKVQGKHFPFSFGDYVVKILMGSVDNWFDTLDERRVKGALSSSNKKEKRKDNASCTTL